MKKKIKVPPIDGLNPKDIKNLRSAIRKVWHWSVPRKLCIKRATDKDGFGICEKCKKRVPKIFADHITNVGELDGGYIERMFRPSKFLQALCKKCHQLKTNEEKQQDFY